MIIDLPSSTTSAVNRKLVELRESGGVFALGRVLTLVVVTDDGPELERAVDAATLFREFGFTPEHVVEAARRSIANTKN